MATTLAADGPLAPSVTSNSTRWFSARVLKPVSAMAEKWTKTSLPPFSGVMKPKPLLSLNHFTEPLTLTAMRLSSLAAPAFPRQAGTDRAGCHRRDRGHAFNPRVVVRRQTPQPRRRCQRPRAVAETG